MVCMFMFSMIMLIMSLMRFDFDSVKIMNDSVSSVIVSEMIVCGLCWFVKWFVYGVVSVFVVLMILNRLVVCGLRWNGVLVSSSVSIG